MEDLIKTLVSIELASPLYFWLGAPLILLFIFSPVFRKTRKMRFDLGYWRKKVALFNRKLCLIPVLIVIISLLTVFILANPQILVEDITQIRGRPVMVVVDISGSTTARFDRETTVSEKIRQVFNEITANQDLGASFALLIYSDDSYIVRDFTSNAELLKDTLENTEEIRQISFGTKTAKALARASIFFKEFLPEAQDKNIVLITDLIDDLSEVGQEIQRCLADGIKVQVMVMQRSPAKAQEKIELLKANLGGEKINIVWAGDENSIDKINQEIANMESALIWEEKTLSRKSLVPALLPALLGLVVLSALVSETVFRKKP